MFKKIKVFSSLFTHNVCSRVWTVINNFALSRFQPLSQFTVFVKFMLRVLPKLTIMFYCNSLRVTLMNRLVVNVTVPSRYGNSSVTSAWINEVWHNNKPFQSIFVSSVLICCEMVKIHKIVPSKALWYSASIKILFSTWNFADTFPCFESSASECHQCHIVP